MAAPELKNVSLFRGLEPDDLQRIAQAGDMLDLEAGERIIEEGAVPQRLVFLLSGSLEVFIPDPTDRSKGKRMATLHPGDSCGEYGFIDRRPASASVKAALNSRVFSIKFTAFDEELHCNPEVERTVYRNLLYALVNRLRASNVVIDLLRPENEDE